MSDRMADEEFEHLYPDNVAALDLVTEATYERTYAEARRARTEEAALRADFKTIHDERDRLFVELVSEKSRLDKAEARVAEMTDQTERLALFLKDAAEVAEGIARRRWTRSR